MIVVDAAGVHAALDYPTLVDTLRSAHRAPLPTATAAIAQEPGGGENQFVSLLAWQAGQAILTKLVGVFPGNLALDPPQPSVQGLVALFDGKTGAPVLVADGAALTFRKTAADSALGADFLARRDATTLLVVGAGGLAPHVAQAHVAVRPSIRRVLIWNRTPARAAATVAGLSIEGVSVQAAADLDKAVAEADVISCVTMAREPLVKGRHLRPGTHVDLIGAYTPQMREADDETVRRGRVYVDAYDGACGSGDIAQPIAAGILPRDGIVGDLRSLCVGEVPGRRSDDEITIYKNGGGAHLDLFTAQALAARLTSSR